MMKYKYAIMLPLLLALLVLSRYTAAEVNTAPSLTDNSVMHLPEFQVLAEVKADEVYQLKQSGKIMSLEELISQVRKDYPGRIIEIDLDNDEGRYVYELELVDDQGLAYELEIDAQNGQVLKYERDD